MKHLAKIRITAQPNVIPILVEGRKVDAGERMQAARPDDGVSSNERPPISGGRSSKITVDQRIT
ncbi:MAG: hypothetical protein E5W56_08930 [Mesorhizobium sp.]|nr:MAG: hypothetical protein E5W56_08930 [Mesorhizobium sp.]